MDTPKSGKMQDTKDQLAKNVIENGENVQVVWLDGQAPEQHNPQAVNISGTITAPSIFVKKRKENIDPLKAHCLVSKSDGKMTLVVNEQSVCHKFTVTGEVYIGKRFKELGINTDKSYSPAELSKKFKLLRSIFPSRSDHTKIVGLLRNIKAKIKADVDKDDDARGNVNLSYKQALETNIPESFKLTLPLLEGEEPTEIEVDIVMELKGGQDIQCWLESIDGADLIEEARTKLVEEEVAKIENDVTVIYY